MEYGTKSTEIRRNDNIPHRWRRHSWVLGRTSWKKCFLSGNAFKWLKLKSRSIRLHPASTNIVMDADIFSWHVYVYTYGVVKKGHRAIFQQPYASNACLACGVLWDARQLWLIVLGVMCYCAVTWLWYGIVRKIDLVCIQSRVWCGVVRWVMQLIEARPRDNGRRAGRWGREIGGSVHHPWELFLPSYISLCPQNLKKISPQCALPMSPQVPSRSWGGLGKEILCENKKANCPADEPQQLMICLISALSPVALGPAASS